MVVVASDAQGASVARPWVEQAGGTYPALLDQHNTIGKLFGVKYVPIGILVDEQGRLVRPVASVNIGQEAFREQLTHWAQTGEIPGAWREMEAEGPDSLTAEEQEADARFQLAVVLLESGKKSEAIDELKRAFRLDPQNWLIRKQLWAIEHPEAYYDGDVDYAWQKQQIEKENAEVEASR